MMNEIHRNEHSNSNHDRNMILNQFYLAQSEILLADCHGVILFGKEYGLFRLDELENDPICSDLKSKKRSREESNSNPDDDQLHTQKRTNNDASSNIGLFLTIKRSILREISYSNESRQTDAIFNLEKNLNLKMSDDLDAKIILDKPRYVKGDDISLEEYLEFFRCIDSNMNGPTNLTRQFSSIKYGPEEDLQSFFNGNENIKELVVGGAGFSRWFLFRDSKKKLWVTSMSLESYIKMIEPSSEYGQQDCGRIEYRETSKEEILKLVCGIEYNKECVVVDRKFLDLFIIW